MISRQWLMAASMSVMWMPAMEFGTGRAMIAPPAPNPEGQGLQCLPAGVAGAVRRLSNIVTARMPTTAPSDTSTGIL